MKTEQLAIKKVVDEENAMLFAQFGKLTNQLLANKTERYEETLVLKSLIKSLEGKIVEQKKELGKVQDKLKKQEILDKSKEIQKESVKIVVNKAKKSSDSLEIKRIIADLIQEIDTCIDLLNEN